MSAVSSSTALAQGQSIRQSTRQTRTNPSRTSKTAVRSSFGYGRGSTVDIPSTPPVPHGFYPAITHFTDAITALPREFRRHNSLLKEVDAKAWALEDNLLQLLQQSSAFESVPHPSNSAPTVNQVREDAISQDAGEATELESKNRRLVFERVRQSLSDLMMTADEKNHVLSNANEELDRQVVRLDTIFPYIAGEVSEEARLGSLSHWAYYNKPAPKATANERPRREAVSHRQDLSHALQDPEVSTRSELRREAVSARNKRRGNVDADYEDSRGARKTATVKSRGDNAGTEQAPKRRKVERPPALEATPMERTASGATSQRGANKDGAEKKRRAPNAGTTAARKKTNATSNAGSPVMAPSPLIGTFNAPRGPGSPGPNTAARPQSSRAQNTGQTGNSRQRPSSSASNRQPAAKQADSRSTPREGPLKETNPTDATRDQESEAARASATTGAKRDEVDGRPADIEPEQPKGRSSKTSTPLIPFAEPVQPRSRPTRSTDTAPNKRNAKKAAAPVPTIPSDDESIHEGDDEDEEGEPRYCYCNEISFGEMVACDNDACPREWFHLSCVGLTKPPGKNVKWYCNECKDNMRRGRNGR